MRVPRIRFVVLASLWVIALAAAIPAWGDDYTNRVGITLGGGAYKLVGGNLDHKSIGPWAQGGLRWGWRRHLDVEGNFRYGFDWDDIKLFRNTTPGLDVGLLWNQRPDAKWTPQVFAGSGVLWWNVDDFRGQPSPGLFASGRAADGFKEDGHPSHLNDSNFKVYGGLGLEYFITHRLSLRGLARIDYLFQQQTDNSGASDSLGASADTTGAKLAKAKKSVDANDWMPSFAFTLTYFFGERDADQDGIPNRLDKCPYEPEDKDAYQDEDGCPDPDNDKDGVLDVNDKCPETPQGVVVDSTGCSKDTDGDGVFDGPDKCPGTPKGATVDALGCPLDGDHDGIFDGLDQCADTPAGAKVDSVGCPIVTSPTEQAMVDGGVIRLTDLHFASSKAEVNPEDFASLDAVGEVLQRWPMAQVEGGGHTDAQGADAKNQVLSEQRAQAVLEYLKTKFTDLNPERLTVKGYGETQPVADNATPEGRAQNRRVEFKVLNREEIQQEIQRRMGGKPKSE
jgi:outer membrane protein OmpA-like peptidoglycan-associated protein